MKNKINLFLVEYAINALVRRGGKHFFIGFIFTFLIFLLSSTLFISDAIKLELGSALHALPEITLQRFVAGKQSDVPIQRVDALLDIEGVKSAIPRVWGYYYFKPAGVNFSVIGMDAFSRQYTQTLQTIVDGIDMKALEKENGMIVGEGVKKILGANYYQDFFNFVTSDGQWKKVFIAGTFNASISLEANDMILLPKKIAYEIFGMDTTRATDIVVSVSNPKEISMVVNKINLLYPDMRTITKDDIRVSYQNIFDYKSGFFLSLFMVCAFTFFIIVYDKLSGLSSEEKKEIGILKAVGWSMDDIIKEKFYESFILSLGAFMLGICFSLFFVYGLQAPLLRDIFMGYSNLKPSFNLPFSVDGGMLCLLFLLSVPIYIGATLIPTWRASILDADEVMR
ncbi:MAG: FtsX-like permease family protein [Sulfurospirillaceae bacterium]|nr:FtsX-like permease family protein [Sulfurospirillaceae bacterium]MDD2827150.1 FtsX-like permease family protein [Sulfurospirillaceae bacterium]